MTLEGIDLKIASRLKPLEQSLHTLHRDNKALLVSVARLSSGFPHAAAFQPVEHSSHEQDHRHLQRGSRSSSHHKREEQESATSDSTTGSEDDTQNSSEQIIQLLSKTLRQLEKKKGGHRKKKHKHR